MNMFPTDWFWIVGGDESRAWSSAAGAYVTTWPADAVTRIVSETELSEVLSGYGRVGPSPLPDQINAECKRRIFAVASQTAQTNMSAARHRMTPEQLLAYDAGLDWINAMRAVCNALIASGERNFADDTHWPPCQDDVIALANSF